MDGYVGEKVKELRLHYNIYQEELADGICTQATISRIEKNEIIPNSYILHQISKRLGVNMDYFYDSGSLFKIEYVKNVHQDLAKHVREKDYLEVLKIVKLEKDNPLFRGNELKQILLWREGLSTYYLENDAKKAFDLLYHALELVPTTKKNTSSIEIDILASIAAIHDEIGMFEKAGEIYADISIKVKKLPTDCEPKLLIRINYNSAVNCYLLKRYHKAIEFCNKNIRLCLSNLTFYTLGETYFQKAESVYKLTKNIEETKFWMEKSLSIFKITDNQSAINYVLEEKKNLVIN